MSEDNSRILPSLLLPFVHTDEAMPINFGLYTSGFGDDAPCGVWYTRLYIVASPATREAEIVTQTETSVVTTTESATAIVTAAETEFSPDILMGPEEDDFAAKSESDPDSDLTTEGDYASDSDGL
jgi:hypothetical protein